MSKIVLFETTTNPPPLTQTLCNYLCTLYNVRLRGRTLAPTNYLCAPLHLPLPPINFLTKNIIQLKMMSAQNHDVQNCNVLNHIQPPLTQALCNYLCTLYNVRLRGWTFAPTNYLCAPLHLLPPMNFLTKQIIQWMKQTCRLLNNY